MILLTGEAYHTPSGVPTASTWLLRALSIALIALFSAACGAASPPDGVAPGLRADGPLRLVGDRNLWTDVPVLGDNGHLNVVVEIPAGTVQKWQVDHTDGTLQWELDSGQPRVVAYLGYPGNYGIAPQTVLPQEEGGDGDPLDVLTLGAALPRGAVVEARLIGVLRLLDRGETDDKLIAVQLDGPFGAVSSLAELNRDFPGVTEIVETWFTSYKGLGQTESGGYEEREAALAILEHACAAFLAHH